MKRIAFLLALVLCFSCFVGIIASAEGETASPSLDIVAYTVPVEAGTISVYFAVAVEGWADDGAYLHLEVKKGDGEFVSYSNSKYARGHKTLDGKRCIILEYPGLTAAEMDVEITARIRGAVGGEPTYGEEVTTSVRQFANDYKANGGKYTALVDAMLAYGDAVKAFQATAQ